MPSFSKKGADSRRNSSLSRPSPRPSSSTSRITFEISDSDSDEGNDSDSIQKDASPELPEVPPLSSPRKTHHKIDIKGKGRAIEPSGPNTSSSTDTTTLDKPKPFPLEAGFHSLDDLANWTDRTTRPPYSLWVLIRCAILGSGIDQLVLEGILSRICNKYPFYQDQVRKSQEERSKLEAALKAAIASKQCFVINRDDRTNVRYGVDKHINPISRRLPAGKKYETGSEGKSTINVKTQTSSVPRVEGTASKGMSPVPPTKPAPPAPPPKEPEYEPVQPDKLPKADLDIFATSLLDLKNAAPPGEEENNDAANLASAKQSTTVNGSETSTIPAARGSYIAMVRKVIPYDLYVPIRAAILGSPYRKLKLKQIVDDLVWKYP